MEDFKIEHKRQLEHYTNLFIERYYDMIHAVIPDSVMSFSYEKLYSTEYYSQVCFKFDDGSCYIFEISPPYNTIRLHYYNKDRLEFKDYKKMLSIVPFIKFDYNKAYEIFDFIESDDLNYDSIKSCKRFNTNPFDENNRSLELSSVSVAYIIEYKKIYKYIHKKSKIRADILFDLVFDEHMNIDILYYVNISFVSKEIMTIYFYFNKDTYYFRNIEMTKEELFNVIAKERQKIIKKDINKKLRKAGLDMDVQFDDGLKDQLNVLEMLTI
jgi:hypothetical protein